MKIAAQIVGLFGIACSLLSFQQKDRKRVMLFQMTASALFCIQLFMVGAITGGCIDSISFIRTVVFSQNDKKWASSPIWLGVFIVAMIVTGLLTWQNAWSILPILGSVLSTIALWMKKSSHIRGISLFVGPCWLVYNLVHGAYTGALNEVLAMTSIMIGIFRHDLKRKSKTENT
ncbi:MAG: YgjV family protein [Ruminococcaceae bacterium]|nr:YgjV family protein [Oscillospiraceae bacterium]